MSASDIVERLRDRAKILAPELDYSARIMEQAAAEIERLRASKAKLVEALKPFAELLERRWIDKQESIECVERGGQVLELQAIELGDVLKARAALAQEKEET